MRNIKLACLALLAVCAFAAEINLGYPVTYAGGSIATVKTGHSQEVGI